MGRKLVLLLCTLTLGLTWATPALPQPKPPAVRAALVKAAPVVQRDVRPQITLTGTAEPHRLVTVASRVEELVASVLVEEGQTVKAGQPLVKLDQRQLALRRAEAGAALREASARLEQLTRDLARKRALYAKRSIPLKSLEDAATEVARQKAVRDRQREAAQLLELDLLHAVVKAPAAGVVVQRLVNPGEWVKKGGAVCKLSVLDPIKVVVKVPERYLPYLADGQKVCCTADAIDRAEFCGPIIAVVPSGDATSRTFPVQIRLANPEGRIKPGMLIRARLAAGHPGPALLVPKDALVISPQGRVVFVVGSNKAVMVPVIITGYYGDWAAVRGNGVKAGQMVVTGGNERLRPGQPVKIQPADKAAPQSGS